MLIFLFLAALLNASRSTPLSSSSSIEARQSHIIPALRPANPTQIFDPADFRDVQDILWSCFATIFTCTWVAVHPNVPDPRRSGWKHFKHQFVTMVIAFTAPEFVLVWALRQRVGAIKHAKEYNNKFNLVPRSQGSIFRQFVDWFDNHKAAKEEEPDMAWTVTHGFLLEMRGLALYVNKRRLKYIEDVSEIPWRLDMPKDEVYDKSKGDQLAKLLVLFQTSWFLAQCVARWATNLYVTQLEVVTLAFACLNFFTYAVWWHKPQNMKVAIPFYTRTQSPQAYQIPPLQRAQTPPRWARYSEGACLQLVRIPYTLFDWFLLFVKAGGRMTDSSRWLNLTALQAPQRSPDFGDFEFYSSERGGQLKVAVPACILGVLFGAVHLIPIWTTLFAGDEGIWIFAAIVMTCQPVVFLFAKVLQEVCLRYKSPDRYPANKNLVMEFIVILVKLADFILPFAFLAYPFVRFILIIMATSVGLENLPPSAYQSVNWSSFFPHI